MENELKIRMLLYKIQICIKCRICTKYFLQLLTLSKRSSVGVFSLELSFKWVGALFPGISCISDYLKMV